MKILIAGLGSIGRRHLRNLRALGQEDILLYRTHRATLPDEELAGLPVFTELSLALAEKPSGVIVSNPSAAHLSVAIPAARAGANLLIEKPVSASMEGLDELETALAVSGRACMVGFHFRYHPVLRQIKALLDGGSLGRPLSARAHWGEYLPGWHPWEDYRQGYAARADLGGGVVNTLSHPLDYLRWLLGDMEEVTARVSKISDLELDVEDNAEILLRFRAGARVSVHLDYYQRPPSHTLEINCSEGRVVWDNSTGTADVYREGDGGWQTLAPPDGFERNDMFLAEMRDFMRLCVGEQVPHCTLEDGVFTQRLVMTVKESSARGGCAVSL